jgi:hypothetical protein
MSGGRTSFLSPPPRPAPLPSDTSSTSAPRSVWPRRASMPGGRLKTGRRAALRGGPRRAAAGGTRPGGSELHSPHAHTRACARARAPTHPARRRSGTWSASPPTFPTPACSQTRGPARTAPPTPPRARPPARARTCGAGRRTCRSGRSCPAPPPGGPRHRSGSASRPHAPFGGGVLEWGFGW